MRNKSAWRTMNWIRIGVEVFMVQQQWTLYREERTGNYKAGHAAVSQEAFPTDEWRIMSLNEVLTDDDLNKLLEARQKELDESERLS